MKILIYCGTFNPVTKAHINLGLETLAKLGLDKVIFVPVGNEYKYKKAIVSGEHRYNMLSLALQELNLKCVEASDYEINLKEYPYTYNTLRYFKKLYPHDEIYYLLGDDNLIWLQDWTYYNKIISEFKCVVANRKRSMQENLKIINNCSAYLDYCDNFIVLDNPTINISSTEVRKCLKNKDLQQAKKYIYPSVYNYILKNNLYIK